MRTLLPQAFEPTGACSALQAKPCGRAAPASRPNSAWTASAAAPRTRNADHDARCASTWSGRAAYKFARSRGKAVDKIIGTRIRRCRCGCCFCSPKHCARVRWFLRDECGMSCGVAVRWRGGLPCPAVGDAPVRFVSPPSGLRISFVGYPRVPLAVFRVLTTRSPAAPPVATIVSRFSRFCVAAHWICRWKGKDRRLLLAPG